MVNVTLTHGEHSTNFADLPESSQRHIIERGFSSMIDDKIAGAKAGIIGKGNSPWKDQKLAAVAERHGLPNERTEANAQAICDAMQLDMFRAIVNGTTRDRSSRAPSLSADDKLRRDIAIELLERWAKEKAETTGKPYELPRRTKPEEKAAFEELLAKATEKWSATIEKEFKARKAKKFDLDDLGL